ncbi:MAG: hypothetical protein HUK40_06330 [Desulfobacter sp.]|nr:hypothetical protein [Desulfobacter sp.]
MNALGSSKDPIEKSEDQPGDAPADTREERLERISGFTAIENLGLTPEAVLAIGEKVLPSIKASAQAF